MTHHTYTDAQRRAIETIDRSVGIVANAGSGKTSVLVERCLRILQQPGMDLNQLLVVTFTEKAAQEIKQRLYKKLPAHLRLSLQGAQITTFHGFATRVLREHAPALGLASQFSIMSDGESAALLFRATQDTLANNLDKPPLRLLCERFAFKNIIQRTLPLLQERWLFEQWAKHADTHDDVTAAIIDYVNLATAHYTQLKKEQQCLDFHDLEIMLWQILQDPSIQSDYQRQFRHILVDEFQDTNELQMQIIGQLYTPPDNILCIVGDPKQSIYRFRGAEVSCFQSMLDVILRSGGDHITLPDNFRSAPDICTFVNAACADMPDYIPLQAQRDIAGSVLELEIENSGKATENRNAEALALITYLPQLLAEGYHYGQMACLFATRATQDLWAEALRQHDIPIHVYNAGGLLERPEIRALYHPLYVLSGLLQKQPNDSQLLAFLMSPLYGASADDCYRLVHLQPTTTPLHRAVMADPELGPWWTRLCERAHLLTPYEILNQIIEDTHYLNFLSAQDPSGQSLANVDAFLRRIYALTRQHSTSLPDFLLQLEQLRRMRERLPDPPATIVHDEAIQLLTIHGAKGNEFPIVILPDLWQIPRPQTDPWLFLPDHGLALRHSNELEDSSTDQPAWLELKDYERVAAQAERQRLLYVALTRAQERLILPLHAEKFTEGEIAKTWHDRLYPLLRRPA